MTGDTTPPPADKTPPQYATGRETAANMVIMSAAEAAAYDRGVAAERARIRKLAIERSGNNPVLREFAELLDGAT